MHYFSVATALTTSLGGIQVSLSDPAVCGPHCPTTISCTLLR